MMMKIIPFQRFSGMFFFWKEVDLSVQRITNGGVDTSPVTMAMIQKMTGARPFEG